MRALLAVVAFALAPIAFMPSPAFGAQNASADRVRIAEQILRTAEPDDVALQLEMRGWEMGIRAALEVDPSIAKLEKEHPGTLSAGIEAGRPVARRYLAQAIAKIKGSKSQLLAEELTHEELDEFLEFARSAAGRAFFSSIHKNVDPGAMVQDLHERVTASGDPTITTADANKAVSSTLAGVHQDLGTAETLAIMRFEQSSAGKKLRALAPRVTKLVLDVANSPDPAWMEEQHERMTEAMIAFVEARLPAR